MTSPSTDTGGTTSRARRDEFVGRQEELEQVARLLEEGEVAWISGPPGVGKTRLAYEVCRRHTERFWFVDAHEIATQAALLNELGRALGLSQVDSLEQLRRSLSKRAIGWVVLDNVDDVVETVHEVATTLAGLGARVICTARIHRPNAIELEGLPPDDAGRLIEARAGRPLNDDGVVVLTGLLEGLPLAIELAARQLDIMSASALTERLTDGFRPATLQAAIQESWERLGLIERETLIAACTFGFEFDLPALEAVCGRPSDNALRKLLQHSLLSRSIDDDGEVRFRALDAVRAFVQEESNPTTSEIEHARYHAALAYDAWSAQHGPDVAHHIDQLATVVRELEVAMEYAIRHALVEPAARLMLGFALHYYYRDTRHRTFEWVERTRALIASSELAFSVWYELAHARIDMNTPDEADEYIVAMEQLAEGVLEQAVVARTRSRQAHHQGDVSRGHQLAEQALELAGKSQDRLEEITSLRNWAGVSYPLPEHHSEALVALHEAARSAARLGALHHEAMSYYLMAYALAESAQVTAERDAIEKALTLFERTRNPGLVLECRWLLGMLEGTLGRSELSRQLLQQVHDEALGAGMFSLARTAAEILFSVEIDAGQLGAAERAIALQEELVALEPDDFAHHWIQVQKGRLLAHRGDLDAAVELLEFSLSTEGPHWNLALKIWPRGVLLIALARLQRPERVAEVAAELGKLAREFENPSWSTFADFATAAGELLQTREELRFATLCAELGQTRAYEYSAEIRSLVRLAGGLTWAAADETTRLDEALLVSADCSRFRPPAESDWVDIAHRKRLVALLARLVQGADIDEGPLSPETLIAATWPDETLTHQSGLNRLRASISMLRKAGLGTAVVFEDGGYRFEDGLDVVRM